MTEKDRPNLGGTRLWQEQIAYLIMSQNDYQRTSKWCPCNAPLPDCGGIGTAFVDVHIYENSRERDVENLPYGLNLIAAVIKLAIADYEDSLFNWLTEHPRESPLRKRWEYVKNHKQLGELGEPYAFLSDWADVLGVSIEWMESIMREEVYKKIKRKERINGRTNNHLR